MYLALYARRAWVIFDHPYNAEHALIGYGWLTIAKRSDRPFGTRSTGSPGRSGRDGRLPGWARKLGDALDGHGGLVRDDGGGDGASSEFRRAAAAVSDRGPADAGGTGRGCGPEPSVGQ